MAKIQATCPDCGTVDCVAQDFRLHVCANAAASYYTFWCPSCLNQVRKHADQRTVQILMAEGVEASVWDVPAEALEVHEGPAFTFDDVLDFHLLLAQDCWESRLVQQTSGHAYDAEPFSE